MDRRDEGQATVELALVLPVLVLFLLALAQVTLVARDQILVVHATRAAAREAAVDPRPASVRSAALAAAPGLKPKALRAEVTGGGGASGLVAVRLVYRSPTTVTLVGSLLPDVELRAKAAMRIER